MAQEITIQFPFNKTVFFYGFANGGLMQEVEIIFEDGSVISMKGTGEDNTPTTPSSVTKTMPATGKDTLGGFSAKVKVFHSDEKSRNPSDLMLGTTSLQNKVYMNYVFAEDGVDTDYNDFILLTMYF